MCYNSTIRLQTDAYAVICNLLLESERKEEGSGEGERARGRESDRAYLTTVLLLYEKHILFDTFRTRRSDLQEKNAMASAGKAKQATCQI